MRYIKTQRLFLIGIILLVVTSCATRLKSIKSNTKRIKSEAIIYGKLAHRYDVTGKPRVYGIPVFEYGIFLRNLQNNKQYYIYNFGEKHKYFVLEIPTGKYEMWYLNNFNHKFPLAKMPQKQQTVMEYMYSVNSGRGAKAVTHRHHSRGGGAISAGFSRTVLDYSKHPYQKYIMNIEKNTINYVGTFDFHLPDWKNDLEKMTYSIKFINEKKDTDKYFSNYPFNIDKAIINIPQ